MVRCSVSVCVYVCVYKRDAVCLCVFHAVFFRECVVYFLPFFFLDLFSCCSSSSATRSQ